jgi:transcriptional regulator with XRE-family HTH domain
VPPVGKPEGRREEDARNVKASRSRDSVEGWPRPERKRGHNQEQAATLLGVTQAYFSMLETGRRKPSARLARNLMRTCGLPPTVLSVSDGLKNVTPDSLAQELASLGYPGFAHLRRSGLRKVNPAGYLLSALTQRDVDARVAEGPPWVVARYPDMDFDWLVPQARMKNLQNRLGFAVTLARLAGGNIHHIHQASAWSPLLKPHMETAIPQKSSSGCLARA